MSFPFFPCGDEILMIDPPPCGRMILRASRLHKKVPVRFVFSTLSHTSNGVPATSRSTGPLRGQAKPALFTRISKRLNFSRTRRKRWITSCSEVTSALTPKTFSNGNPNLERSVHVGLGEIADGY